MSNTLRCPHCGSRLIRAGHNWGAYGKKQRYRCTNRRCFRTTIHPVRR